MNRHIGTLLFLLLVTLSPTIAYSIEPLRPAHTTVSPTIDGIINDAIWANAPSVSEFTTFAPDFGKQASQQTRVWSAYDADNLYFAFRCEDMERDKIKTSVTTRDNMLQDDWVCINLDTFNDQQGLTAFYINPLGIQADSRFASGKEDFSLDVVWESAGTLDSTGFCIEARLPLRSLRYAHTDPVEMSVFFERYISRLSEHSSYPAMDPAKGMSLLTQMQPLQYYGVQQHILLEILPAFTYGQQHVQRDGSLQKDEERSDLSLTAKYGITSDLVIDGTYNPDFSQVEADAGQVDINLRYSLFYTEKRPFFLEGNDYFTFGGTTLTELDPVRSIVHTRTIVDPLVGTKLTGKIGQKNTVAVLYAKDRFGEANPAGDRFSVHVPIVRYRRALGDDSYLGALVASREFTDHYNRAAGIDQQIRVSDAGMLDGSTLFSWQRQAPGEPARNGYTAGLAFRNQTRDLDVSLTARDISTDFTADMGYITRTGLTTFSGLARPKFYPSSDFVQRIDGEVFSAQTRDKFSSSWETFNHASVLVLFGGSMQAKVKYSYSTEIFQGQRYKTGGFHVALAGQFTTEFYASLLYRRIQAIYYDDPMQGWSNRITFLTLYQPSDKLQLEGSFLFSDFTRSSDDVPLYSYPITRLKIAYQFNQYLLARVIGEYNGYRHTLMSDYLVSFTYIPGTVFHIGYGSLYEQSRWDGAAYVDGNRFLEMKNAFFLKASYLWRV